MVPDRNPDNAMSNLVVSRRESFTPSSSSASNLLSCHEVVVPENRRRVFVVRIDVKPVKVAVKTSP